jgi:L-ascorbate metabolism protein UlaG (beta-lactamase superfamily)
MSIKFRYLGWTAFELTFENGIRLITDPMLAGRPHEGVPVGPVQAEDLKGINLVVISHGAGDHIGQAFDILKLNPEAHLVCDTVTRYRALEAGIEADRIHYMVSGVQYELFGIKVKGLFAAHHSFTQLDNKQFVTAQPLSHLITGPSGERVFFGGDTSITSDHKLYGEIYKPDVALLGVGGVDILGQSCTELYPDEAALVSKFLGVSHAFPMHYRFDEGKAFEAELAKVAPGAQAVVLKSGETFEFSRAEAVAA